MPCDHAGPAELIEMAEASLRQSHEQIASGMRFGHGENLEGGMWASVWMEIERRGDQWIVTRLDRNSTRLESSKVGLQRLA